MTNADKFKNIFGLYATELWSMPEKDFLKWLNSEAMNCSEFPNNSDTISRQAAIDIVVFECGEWIGLAKEISKQLKQLPPAQPEHKKGKWIKKMRVTETEKYISYDPEWYCACCGTKYDPWMAEIVNFCYVCGADMRGEQE